MASQDLSSSPFARLLSSKARINLEEQASHTISCLCGAVRQEVISIADTQALQLCHCDTCRHSSGVLFTSHSSILRPTVPDKLRSWQTADIARYFCSICGCHMFIERDVSHGGASSWEVATGVVSTTSPDVRDATYLVHGHHEDTKDGGASVWIMELVGDAIFLGLGAISNSKSLPTLLKAPKDSLQAACACGNTRFHVTRPDSSSYEPHSNYPDLMYPDKTFPESLKSNPKKEKWWIQGDGKKYMAGTCSCRSCRLSTGFEIQQWAFVPRANIFIHTKQDEVMALDFEKLPKEILKTYNSSPGVFREFCGGCGATVFWHDTSRPDLMDVSVGLLMAEEGARAESWLSWWTERVSFEEDTETGREGYSAKAARSLVTALEKGIKRPSPKLQHGFAETMIE